MDPDFTQPSILRDVPSVAESTSVPVAAVPRRRFHLELKLGADDRETLVSELREITRQISLAHLNGDCLMGGYSAGYALNLTEDPTMTHDRYMAAIDPAGAEEDRKGL